MVDGDGQGRLRSLLVEMTDILGETGITLSTDILLIQGRLRYLSDWDREITTRLMSRAVPAVLPTVIRPHARTGQRVEHRLVITEVPAGRARRFDYTKCKTQASGLYHRHVTVTAADSPLTLTFAKSGTWDGIKSQGWSGCAEVYGERRAVGSSWDYRQQVAALSDVRQSLAKLKAAEQSKRIELGELILEKDSQPRPYTHEGGVVRVRRSAPRQSIRLDLVESHPELREFLVYTDRKAFTRVEFRPVEADPEGDDDNENVLGIWHP